MKTLLEKVDEYLNEEKKGIIQKVIKDEDGDLALKVKGISAKKAALTTGDGLVFNDTPNVKKLGFEPGAGCDIIKINKNGTIKVEGNTDKREDVRKIVKMEDVYWPMDG